MALAFDFPRTFGLTKPSRVNEEKRKTPWKVSDAPEVFINRQLRGIVGIEIEIDTMEGTWKVSQNKTDRDREGVRIGLLE
ncbi:MAG: FMN-binding negative transcriptional regulator [Alphaproteobacteria bacterium]